MRILAIFLLVLFPCFAAFSFVPAWPTIMRQSIKINECSGDKYHIAGIINDEKSAFLLALLQDYNGPKSKSGTQFEQLINSLRIDFDQKSIARLGDKICYLYGSVPWESTKTRLWIEKDTLFPLQVDQVKLDKTTSKAILLSTKFLDWSKETERASYPRRVERWKAGVLTESFNLHLTPKIKSAKLQHLKAKG